MRGVDEHAPEPRPQPSRTPAASPAMSAGAGAGDAYRRCEAITRRRAANFYYGIRLLPAEKRRAMSAAYAFARPGDGICGGPLRAAPKPPPLRQPAPGPAAPAPPGGRRAAGAAARGGPAAPAG